MLICEKCFADNELRSEVVSNSTSDGVCEVSLLQGKLIDTSCFSDFFEALLLLFEPSEEGMPVADIVQKDWHLFSNNRIAEVLLNETLQSLSLDFKIKDNVDYSLEIKDRVGIWERLKKNVKEESRFFTNLDEFARYNYLAKGDKNLVAGTNLYRSRITPYGRDILKTSEMGCPPPNLATAGRANPLGIPYLYLSDSAKTTYFEVRAVYLDRLSVGKFYISQSLDLVDFCYDISLYLSYVYGDASLKEVVIKKKVIDSISRDLSKPLRRYDSEIEYVPTQLICEFCKEYVHADGICFESSLYRGGLNYVLFDPQTARCINVECHEITKINIDIDH